MNTEDVAPPVLYTGCADIPKKIIEASTVMETTIMAERTNFLLHIYRI